MPNLRLFFADFGYLDHPEFPVVYRVNHTCQGGTVDYDARLRFKNSLQMAQLTHKTFEKVLSCRTEVGPHISYYSVQHPYRRNDTTPFRRLSCIKPVDSPSSQVRLTHQVNLNIDSYTFTSDDIV